MSRDDYEVLYEKAISGDPLAMYDLGRIYPLGYDGDSGDQDMYWITKAYIYRDNVSKEVSNTEQYKDKMMDASITVGLWYSFGSIEDLTFGLKALQTACDLAAELGYDDIDLIGGRTLRRMTNEMKYELKTRSTFEEMMNEIENELRMVSPVENI